MSKVPDPMDPVSPTGFGVFISTLRRRLDVPLRRFCEQHGLDPGNYSKMERGLRPAPKDHGVRGKVAGYLKLTPEQVEWREFMDLADLSLGQLPRDLLADGAIAPKLPLLFRSLRGDPLSEEQFRELAELIRRKESAEPEADDNTLFAETRPAFA